MASQRPRARCEIDSTFSTVGCLYIAQGESAFHLDPWQTVIGLPCLLATQMLFHIVFQMCSKSSQSVDSSGDLY